MLTTHKIFISKYSLSGLSQIFTLQSIQNHISLSFSTYALMFRSLIITPEALHGTHPRAALFCRSRVYLKPPKAMTTDTSTINGLISITKKFVMGHDPVCSLHHFSIFNTKRSYSVRILVSCEHVVGWVRRGDENKCFAEFLKLKGYFLCH